MAAIASPDACATESHQGMSGTLLDDRLARDWSSFSWSVSRAKLARWALNAGFVLIPDVSGVNVACRGKAVQLLKHNR